MDGTNDKTQSPLTASDINWTLAPTPHLESIPRTAAYLLSLSQAELLDYILDLREDAATVREHWHTTMTALAESTARRERDQQTIDLLRKQLRERPER